MADADKPSDDGKKYSDISQILQHVKSLEEHNKKLSSQLEQEVTRNNKLSEKTRQNMQHVLDTIMSKWIDAVDTNEPSVKDQFKTGLMRLVENSAEDNGVWQMMVCASNLYKNQSHELENLRIENNTLKERVNGSFADEEARIGKRKAEGELQKPSVVEPNIWTDFFTEMKKYEYSPVM